MAYRYKTIKVNGKTVLLHRHIMATALGGTLPPGVHVHHKNENPHDNRLENLEIVTPKQHADRHELQQHPLHKPCEVCGVVFTPHPTKRKRAKTCSATCANQMRTGRPRGARDRAPRRRRDA